HSRTCVPPSSPRLPYTTLFRSQHHWVIETPRGSMSLGHCKRCGEEREFRNSATDHLWEDESGSGYNAWRGSRPSRAVADDDEVRSEEHTSELQSPDQLV